MHPVPSPAGYGLQLDGFHIPVDLFRAQWNCSVSELRPQYRRQLYIQGLRLYELEVVVTLSLLAWDRGGEQLARLEPQPPY